MGRLRGKLRSLRVFLQSAGGFTRLPKQQEQRPSPISRASSTRSNLFRSFSTSAAFSLPDPSPSSSSPSSAMLKRCDSAISSCSRRVPKGYLPVRVGVDEQLVYAVKAKILNDPLFCDLLFATAEESKPGILHLSCDIRTFERTLALLSTK